MRRLLAVVLLAPLFANADTARSLVPLYDAAGVAKACKEGLASAGGIFAAMKVEPGAGAIFAEWNRLEIAVEDVVYPMWLLGQVHPEKAVRDAAERCLQENAAFSAERLQSRALFARVKAAQPADARQAKL